MTKLTCVDAELGLHVITRLLRTGWMLGSPVVAHNRDVVVVSPIAATSDETHVELAQLGTVRALLAPNHYHYLGLETWHLRYPDAVMVASTGARPRLAKKVPALALAGLDSLQLPAPWRAERPPGLKNGEVWLRARGNHSVWVVGDAFFHVPGPVSGLMGLMLRATGTAPGLRIGGTWRPLHVSDRRGYREWLIAELERDPPDVVLPLHGNPITGPNLGERLQALASERL